MAIVSITLEIDVMVHVNRFDGQVEAISGLLWNLLKLS